MQKFAPTCLHSLYLHAFRSCKRVLMRLFFAVTTEIKEYSSEFFISQSEFEHGDDYRDNNEVNYSWYLTFNPLWVSHAHKCSNFLCVCARVGYNNSINIRTYFFVSSEIFHTHTPPHLILILFSETWDLWLS